MLVVHVLDYRYFETWDLKAGFEHDHEMVYILTPSYHNCLMICPKSVAGRKREKREERRDGLIS